MKKITISVPEDVYRQARINAAERNTSLGALVREFLTNLGQNGSDFARLKTLQNERLSAIKRFRARDRLSREEAHERNAVD